MSQPTPPEDERTASTGPHEAGGERAPSGPGAPGSAGEQPGDWIGPYKLLGIIGEGGFGTVWLAQRREPMVQRVALKIIKAGMDTKSVIARFEQERQALAVMDHPNVARVHDAGVTGTGRPYLVMEFVTGEPITDYCDRHRLALRQRLALFVQVCEAVQHAHHKGIIHRDLKPSNILVGVYDGRAVPKVIDFGVAKAVTRSLTEKTIFTETGHLIGTPEYMSPEQAEMGRTDIDTRADVYSLGAVLYELLAGRVPFDAKRLRSAGYDEIRRIIREEDPPKPSTRLTRLEAATSADIARNRGVQSAQLASALSTELDWIPLKAMRKDRTLRYKTPQELADDIGNYLEGRPLSAAPESRWYIARKTLRRHRQGAVLTLLALAVAFASVGGIIWRVESTRREVSRTLTKKHADQYYDEVRQWLAQLDRIERELLGRALASSSWRMTPITSPEAFVSDQRCVEAVRLLHRRAPELLSPTFPASVEEQLRSRLMNRPVGVMSSDTIAMVLNDLKEAGGVSPRGGVGSQRIDIGDMDRDEYLKAARAEYATVVRAAFADAGQPTEDARSDAAFLELWEQGNTAKLAELIARVRALPQQTLEALSTNSPAVVAAGMAVDASQGFADRAYSLLALANDIRVAECLGADDLLAPLYPGVYVVAGQLETFLGGVGDLRQVAGRVSEQDLTVLTPEQLVGLRRTLRVALSEPLFGRMGLDIDLSGLLLLRFAPWLALSGICLTAGAGIRFMR